VCVHFVQRSGDLNELEADYESKQSDLDVLQNEVVKLEGIVAAISENVRDRKHNITATSSSTTVTEEEYMVGAGAVSSPPAFVGSPANRLATSAANAAMVARQLADEEERQFGHSMSVLSATASAARAAHERSPFRGEHSADVQRSLQAQLDELEHEVQTIAADRRRARS